MSRALLHRRSTSGGDPADPYNLSSCSAPHWHRFPAVRCPGIGELRIDVVVGPSGVHVVVDRCAVEARQAALAVATLLPPRYAAAVRPVLCDRGAHELTVSDDGVLVAPPQAVGHYVRHGARVLSTSEVRTVALALRARLESSADEGPAGVAEWGRWVLGVLARPCRTARRALRPALGPAREGR